MPGNWTPDPKGERILFETFWSPQGWRTTRSTPADALIYAKQSGYMFEPLKIAHSELIRQLAAVRRQITPTEVATAFADSLVSKRLDLRSALGSYGAALRMPEHKAGFSPGTKACSICRFWDGEENNDLNVLSFERFKWGGVRHANPLYALHDLSRFREALPQPTGGEGRSILVQIIQVAGNMAAAARSNDLLRALRPIASGNDSQRRVVLECLSYAGVLQPGDHEGFFDSYPIEREDLPDAKNDWAYPFAWWRGRDGINAKALKVYFPDISA